jgi:TonB family protein
VARAVPRSEGGVPGGEDWFRRGRGRIDGEPIPLDTPDPRYTDYFERIRKQIKAYWIYPREAGERAIGGQLIIDFAIAKSGELEAVELRRTSGVHVLDLYALNAVKLAQPFPPVPDAVSRGVLPIRGIFTYQIVDTGLLNQFLR